MIKVTYLPSDSGHIGDGDKIKEFSTHSEFKEWVKKYVCNFCLKDYKEFTGREPLTVGNYLSMGCGCEVEIEDTEKLIEWKDEIG